MSSGSGMERENSRDMQSGTENLQISAQPHFGAVAAYIGCGIRRCRFGKADSSA